MDQKIIRKYNNQTYSVAEGAAIIKELDDRTKSLNAELNSIDQLSQKFMELEGNVEKIEEKEITTGGQKNDLATDKTSIILTGQNAATIITGFSDGSEGKDVLVYNRSDFKLDVINDSSDSDSENRILCQKGYDTKINIDDVAHFRYYDIYSKWVLISWGNDYIPTLVGDGVRAVTVDGDGILNFEEIVEIETKREGQLTEMTNVELESAYPDAIEGFSVKCPFITTGGLMYSKLNDQGEWAKTEFKPL